jgi:uncharacterized protein YecT (DUF1311 family)
MLIFFTAVAMLVSPLVLAGAVCDSEIETQAQATQCMVEKSRRFKAKFDDLIEQLVRSLPPEQTQRLLLAQSNWQEMLEHDCRIVSAQLEGGSARSMLISKCYLDHRRQRFEQLKFLLCGPMVFDCAAVQPYQLFLDNFDNGL